LRDPDPLTPTIGPLVTYQAPRFAYANTEPIYRPLFALLDLFRAAPEQVLAPPQNMQEADKHRRLSAYWTARNPFLKLGVGIKETDDIRDLLSQVKGPLLDIVRLSRDFDSAYLPLLKIAQRLAKIDSKAAGELLAELEYANPHRNEARLFRNAGFQGEDPD